MRRGGKLATAKVLPSASASRLQSSNLGTLRVRSDPETRGITPADRVKINGTVNKIVSIINPDQRNAWLEMLVEAGAGS